MQNVFRKSSETRDGKFHEISSSLMQKKERLRVYLIINIPFKLIKECEST